MDTAAPTTPVAGGQATSTDFCSQESPRRLIADLRTALSTEDGALLASLVDPVHGMDVQLIREGPIINYDRAQAMEILASDAASDWGQAPGSGLALRGSFRALVLPALLEVLNRNPSFACNHILAEGATFTPAWPYAPVDFYSAFYPGTEANGRLDWRTWLFGMRTVKTRLYLYAMTQLRWEP